MSKVSKAEIRLKARLAIDRHEAFIKSMSGNSNPFALEMVVRTQGVVGGIRLMLDAINGDMWMLNYDAKGLVDYE
jgi:hypothetical protein